MKTKFSREILDDFQMISLLPRVVSDQCSKEVATLVDYLSDIFGKLLERTNTMQQLKQKVETNHWQHNLEQHHKLESVNIFAVALVTLKISEKTGLSEAI